MAVKPVPEGYHTVTPFLTVSNAADLLRFVKEAFGAQVVEAMDDGDGNLRHADVLIGDSHVMFGQASDEWPARPGSLYLYVEDVDSWYHRAMSAGASSIRKPTDEFYGDRSAGVSDAQGNQWWIATHIEDVSKEEMERRAAANWSTKA